MGDLTFTERMLVEYAGERAVDGPLTLGQINTLEWLGDDTRAGLYRMMEWAVTVPDGTTLDDVAETLAALVERHESLRTSCVTGDSARQRVSGSGRVAVDVYETKADAGSPVDPEEVTDLIAALQARPVDEMGNPMLRAAVAVHDGAIRLVLIACNHLAVDCESLAVVVRQFDHMIRHPAERRAGPRTHQPVDQAAVEHSPRGRRRAEASLRYWGQHMSRMPQSVYAMPRPAGGAERDVRHAYAVPGSASGEGAPLGCWLDSPALRLALPHVAARTQTTLPMVLSAAFCAVLAWRTGNTDLVFASLANNRIGRDLHDYVGTLAQDTLLAVDADTTSFDQLIRRAGSGTLRAAMHGLYDVKLLQNLQAEIGDRRGVLFQRDCACNINLFESEVRPAGPPEEAQAALDRTTLRWHVPPYFRVLLLLRVIDSDGEPLLGLTTGHADLVPAAEIESLLLGIDRLLAEAATGDVDLRRMTEITGLTPVVRGPEWQRVDGCWIELPEVQRLVDDAVRVPARVFAAPDDHGRTVLTAYVTAGGPVRTPGRLTRPA